MLYELDVRERGTFQHEALAAFHRLSELEGIIPALESAHAIAWLLVGPEEISTDARVVVCLSGRGDKDVQAVLEREASGGGDEG